ncbi:MAG TPA: hypothetical protein ENH80_06375 [Phycisphaerae bacterium]|nr:hypothetical protein [Phycisphaerae bacterium]
MGAEHPPYPLFSQSYRQIHFSKELSQLWSQTIIVVRLHTIDRDHIVSEFDNESSSRLPWSVTNVPEPPEAVFVEPKEIYELDAAIDRSSRHQELSAVPFNAREIRQAPRQLDLV